MRGPPLPRPSPRPPLNQDDLGNNIPEPNDRILWTDSHGDAYAVDVTTRDNIDAPVTHVRTEPTCAGCGGVQVKVGLVWTTCSHCGRRR